QATLIYALSYTTLFRSPRPRLYSRALRVGAARLPRGGGALPLGAAGTRGLRPEPRARIAPAADGPTDRARDGNERAHRRRGAETARRPLRALRAEPAGRRRGSLPPGRHRRPRRDRARVQGRGRRGAPGGERRLERALRRAPPRQRDRDLQRLRGVAPRRRPTRGLRLERRDGERVRARHAVPRPRGGPLRRGG